MELKEFIYQTIKSIIEATAETQIFARKLGAKVNPPITFRTDQGMQLWDKDEGQPIQQVEFDVTITASKDKNTKGGIGISIANIGLKSQGASGSQKGSADRIKFSIPIMLPIDKNSSQGKD